jgi:hypothetical protein
MAGPLVISALQIKRAEIAGMIRDLERRLDRQRAALANLDATIRLFADVVPEPLRPKRAYRRNGYFKTNELHRLTLDALRLAPLPVTATDIAYAVMRTKGMNLDDLALGVIVKDRTLATLRGLLKRGDIVKHGMAADARWSITPSLL